jgi:hypothetical protein
MLKVKADSMFRTLLFIIYFVNSNSLYSLGAGGTNILVTTVTTIVITTSPLLPSNTPTSGFTNFSVTTPSTITLLYLDCLAISLTTYTI